MSLLVGQCLQDVHLIKKVSYYRGNDCIEKLYKKLKERVMKIINYEEKEMIPLTNKENKSCKEKSKRHAIHAKKSFVQIKMMKIIKIKERLKIIVITQENLEELLTVNAI